MAIIEKGATDTEVDVVDQGTVGALLVTTPGVSATGATIGAGSAGAPAVVLFSENDPGSVTGTRDVSSPETDSDYRLRVALDTVYDTELFNYTSQNTGKHSHAFTTVTATVSANGLLVNSGSGVATATGMTFGSFAEFPVTKDGTGIYVEQNVACNLAIASIPSQVTFDIGLFRRGASTAFAPTDGVYFRFSSTGVRGAINNNGVETQTSLFAGDVTGFLANENHKYGILLTEKSATFWIDDVLVGSVSATTTDPQIFRSASLPWSLRYANTGAVGAATQFIITAYAVTAGGPLQDSTPSTSGNRRLGSYQGLSGGTMGSLAGNVANNTQPTAALPTNTSLTANLLAGLGGTCIETDTLAVNQDGLIMSYQVPAGTVAVQGKRLVISGIRIDSFVQTAMTGGGYNDIFFLCFGHTAASLATAESASFATGTAKAPRRIVLGSRTLASGAVALTQMGAIQMSFANPIFVNPGEFVALARRKVGTAPSAGALQHCITLDYGWE